MERFFVEMAGRFLANQPWFFKVVTYLSLIIAFVTGLPGLLEHMCTNMEICVVHLLPEAWVAIYSKVASTAAMIGALIARFATTSEDKDKKGILEA